MWLCLLLSKPLIRKLQGHDLAKLKRLNWEAIRQDLTQQSCGVEVRRGEHTSVTSPPPAPGGRAGVWHRKPTPLEVPPHPLHLVEEALTRARLRD